MHCAKNINPNYLGNVHELMFYNQSTDIQNWGLRPLVLSQRHNNVEYMLAKEISLDVDLI